MSTYTKSFTETKYMSALIEDDELLEKDNEIRNNVSKRIKKGFQSEQVCNEEYLKSNIKPCEGKINTNFHEGGIPKKGSHCICLSVILLILFLK